MKIISITIFLVVFIQIDFFGQSNSDGNNIHNKINSCYVEILGPAQLYSINYEHGIILKNQLTRLNGRIGFSLANRYFTGIPLGANIEFGKKTNLFQINTNRYFSIQGENSNTSIGLAFVRRALNRFYFHTSISFLFYDKPIGFWDGSLSSHPWLGIGLGKSF